MKHMRITFNYRYALSLMVLLGLLTAIACGGDDEDELTIKTTMQGRTWKLQKATVDGIDETDIYEGLTLKFTESAYESTNGHHIFHPIGTWNEATNQTVNFDGELQAEVVLQSKEKITLKFDWDDITYGSGRVSSISGAHEFELVVQ